MALEERDFDLAAVLVRASGGADWLIDRHGRSLLHDAAEDGDLSLVRWLLREGARRSLNSCDECGLTPLAAAVDGGRVEVVRTLLQAGANPNERCSDRGGNPPLLLAVKQLDIDSVRLLSAAGADESLPGWMGVTTLSQLHEWESSGMRQEFVAQVCQVLGRRPGN